MANPRTVLIVDDNPDIRSAMGSLLEEEGYGVAFADNGRDALSWLDSHAAPSLILLDLMMPVMDGRQFLARRQEQGRAAGVPVVLLSAASDSVVQAEKLGAAEVLRKPIQLEDLLAAVERHTAG